ncbi:hypothetical protein Tco_1192561 [Tanacetum coccineum]
MDLFASDEHLFKVHCKDRKAYACRRKFHKDRYIMNWTYPRTIFDGVDDTDIEKFDNLFLNKFFHVWVKSTLSLNDGLSIILKVDFMFAERWADAQSIRCFPNKCFLVIFENRNKSFLLIRFEQSGYDYWKKGIFF